MASISERKVLKALRDIQDPDRGRDIVELGMITGLVIKDGNVGFAIEVDPARGEQMEPVRKRAEEAVFGLKGVTSVTAVLTAHREASSDGPTSDGPASDGPANRQTAAPPQRTMAPDVGAIIAIASGKGGVGKSTTAANLALAMAAEGATVGLMDADVYGPSMPRMMGITGQPEMASDEALRPLENFGVKVMSMGFMVDEDTPMIWRGPMVMSAIQQMLRDVEWGALDVLVVDMPPGTGDAQLTLAQQVPLAGAVIVSTPQDIALLDARKGLNMFRKVDVPVLGIIENMSYFECPHCHERSEIFGHGGARATAGEMDVDFLGEIPLDLAIRETGDSGHPIVVADPESSHAAAYRDIAAKIMAKLDVDADAKPAPRIVVQ